MKEYTNVKPKFAFEFLDMIAKLEGEEQEAKLKEYGALSPLNFLLAMNFDSNVVLDLPSGMPPYNRNESDHQDLYAPLSTCIKRIMLCTKQNTQTRKVKKEHVFIQMLEGINPKEADILVACKDKALHELYPTITKELVQKVFPAYVN